MLPDVVCFSALISSCEKGGHRMQRFAVGPKKQVRVRGLRAWDRVFATGRSCGRWGVQHPEAQANGRTGLDWLSIWHG